MTRRGVLALAGLVPAVGACGRAGPPRQPGPREQIIYPRAYPAPDPPPRAAAPAAPLPPPASPVPAAR